MPTMLLKQPVVSFRSLAAVPSIEGGVTTWIQLLKTGQFYDWRYGDFTVTAEDLDKMVEHFAATDVGAPGDYDHSFTMGQGSMAAGWTKQLQIRGDELWGEVEFTAAAAESIRAGEYKFISPEFTFAHFNERGENEGPALEAWALTNRPFLEGMEEVSLARDGSGFVLSTSPGRAHAGSRELSREPRPDDNQKEPSMDFISRLRETFGLSADASEEDVLAKAAEVLQLSKPKPDVVTLSRGDHDKLVARAAEADKAEEELRLDRRKMVLDKATTEGRMMPVEREALESLFDQDPVAVVKLLDARPTAKGFGTPSGGGATQDAPTEPDDDAPISDRIQARAITLQREKPQLEYEAALLLADRQIRGRNGAETADITEGS